MSIRSEKNQFGKTILEDLHALNRLSGATQIHLKFVKSGYVQPKKATTWVELLWDALQSGQ